VGKTTLGLTKIDNSAPVVVLVSSQHGGLGIIRSLGRLGILVYGVHRDRWEPASLSRFLGGAFRWDFNAVLPSDSLTFLRETAEKVGKTPILIPTSDLTALFVAEHADQLREHYRLASSSAEVVRAFFSKQLTFDICKKFEIPTAKIASPRSMNDLLIFLKSVAFPVIVKGEYGEFLRSAGKYTRVAIVRDEHELLAIYDLNAKKRQIIVQEYIPGDDDTVWMFNGYFDAQSQCLFGATGRKLRQFPAHRGSTSLGICARNEVVEAQTMRLMRALAYRGPLDLGYRFDIRDGGYKLLDVNPRIGATFRLFTAPNGVDVARALYLNLTGQSVPPAQVNEGRKWIVETNDLVSVWEDIRRRRSTVRDWRHSLRGVQEGVWLDSDDLFPLFTLPLFWFRKHGRTN
jgi:D-aspartate ligase